MINHDKPIWWRDRRRDGAWKSSPRSTGWSSPDSHWHSKYNLTHFQTKPHRHLMDGRKNAWMDVLSTCWKHGQMERSTRWRCSYPWDSELAITLRRWFLFFPFAVQQSDHVRSVSGFTLLPLVKISFSNHQNRRKNVWPAAPSYPPSRSPNTGRTAGFPPGCGQLLPVDLPSPGRHLGATYISTTARQVSYISSQMKC